PISRNPGAYQIAIAIVEEFSVALAAARSRGPVEVRKLVDDTRKRLHDLQGRKPEERPHFAKSLSNMALSLNEQGEEAESIRLLEWALMHGAADAYTYAMLVNAFAKTDDLVRAQD